MLAYVSHRIRHSNHPSFGKVLSHDLESLQHAKSCGHGIGGSDGWYNVACHFCNELAPFIKARPRVPTFDIEFGSRFNAKDNGAHVRCRSHKVQSVFIVFVEGQDRRHGHSRTCGLDLFQPGAQVVKATCVSGLSKFLLFEAVSAYLSQKTLKFSARVQAT